MRHSKHELHAGLVAGLIKLYERMEHRRKAGVRNFNEIHIRRDLMLTRDEWTNFSKLQYLGLVTQWLKSGKKRRGYWAITERGVKFLQGTLKIQQGVETFNRKRVRWFGPLVGIKDFERKLPNFTIDAPVEALPKVVQASLLA